jgi:hypothetical protein
MMGKWSTKWEEVNASPWLTDKQNGKRWITNVIEQLFKTAWDLWEHRNGILFAPGGPREQEEHAAVDPDIHTNYGLGSEYFRPQDRHLLSNHTLEEVLQWSVDRKKQWLRLVEIAWERAHEPGGPRDPFVIQQAQARAQQAAQLRNWLTAPQQAI